MGTEDKIVILIEAVDKTNQALANLQKNLGGIKNEAMSFGKLLGGITLGNILSNQIQSLTQHILAAAKATLKWSGDMETFGLSITSSLVTGGKYVDQMSGKALSVADSFGMARQQAKGILEELQAANLQTIATLDQLARVYVETIPIALQKGFNTQQVKDFTLATVQAAGAIGLEMDMIAEETRAMLTPSINPRFSRVAVALGLTNEDIRQHSQNADTLFKFLMGKLEGFRLAGELTQRTWRGLWSNLKDIGLQAGGAAVEPLFLAIKAAIEGALAGIIRVNEETKKIEWNPEFLQTIENIKQGFERILWLMGQISTFGGATKGAKIEELSKVLELRNKGVGATDERSTWGKIKQDWLQLDVESSFAGKENRALLDKYKSLTNEQIETALEFENTKKGVQARSAYEKLRKPDKSDQYAAMMSIAGTTFNLDPNFIRSVMMAESGGQAGAVSPKGAMGLMQIMPSNVNEFMTKLLGNKNIGPQIAEMLKGFESWDQAAMDPMINILMGAQYLRENFDKQGVGNVSGTLAAYNMGPGKFSKYEKNAWGLPDETQKYISKVEKNYAKYGGTDIFAENQYAFQGNEQMSKSDIEMSKKSYDTKLKMADKFTQTQTQILDSGAKLQQAVLEANYAAGVISEEDYYETKNAITQTKLQKELDLIENQSAVIYDAFREGLMTNLTQPSEEADLGIFRGIFGDEGSVEDEKLKVMAKLEDLKSKKQSIQDEMAISDALEEKRKSQLSLKVMEINNREAESYEKTANKITTEIEKIKVKYNEMLPGDALVAEHEREIKALENHIKNLGEEIEKTPLGGVAWTKKMGDIVGINAELVALREKTPYVKKESVFITEDKRIQMQSQILQAKGQLADLNADMETLARISLDQTVNSLKEMANKLREIGEKGLADKLIEMVTVLQARGSGAFAGIVDGLEQVIKSIGSTKDQFSRLTSGIGQELRSSLSAGIYDLWKGNINWSKSSDLSDVTGQLSSIEAQKQAIALKKEQISANDSLSASEKTTQQAALDTQLKQLEVQQQLLNSQKQAIENSKSVGEVFQGFLDRITAKIADFMADSMVTDFMGFLTGKPKEGMAGKEGGLVNTIRDLWNSIKGTTSQGITDVSDMIAANDWDTAFSGGGIPGAVSNMWSDVANTTGGWLQSIFEAISTWVKEVIAQLMAVKSAGSGGFSWPWSTDTGPADSSYDWDINSDYWHKGGFIPKYHMGGLTDDEMPIIAKRGEYVLSREDVDFVNKVKSSGPSININMGSGIIPKPTIVPMGVNVIIDNASSVALQASSQARQVGDANYIIDVVLKDINTRGRLGRLGR